jgi:hypothetical protein
MGLIALAIIATPLLARRSRLHFVAVRPRRCTAAVFAPFLPLARRNLLAERIAVRG